jgi:hypothetical protein
MGVVIIFAGLLCGWIGWKIVNSALKLGRSAATVGFSYSNTVGMMQLFAFIMAAPLLLTAVLGVPVGLYDLVEKPLKVRELRNNALASLDGSKKLYAEAFERYSNVKSTLPPDRRKADEKEIAKLKWYAERTPDEVIAEADQFTPETFLTKFLDDDVVKRNAEVDLAQVKARIARMERSQ